MASVRFPRLLTVSLLMAAVLAIQPAPAHAWNANARFCFRDVINTPDTWLQPPNIDGVVSGDNGWTSAWRYVFNNGTFVHDVIVQGIKDANFVYLSFEINHDPSKDEDDAIVIAIDPTGAPANRRLLQIFPFGSSPTASPVLMNYWQATPWAAAALPAQTQAAGSVSGASGNYTWVVEVKLPRTGFGIPGTGDFGLYFNVLPVYVDLAPDHPWPPNTASMNSDLQNTPDVNTWGQGTVAAVTCNGVYINPSDIRTDNAPPTKINLNAPNTFRVTAHNTTIDSSTGAFVAANDIRATFRIANFGLPSVWQPVNATAPATNPTATTNIAASSTADLTTSWTLNATEQANYAAHDHQCILVELENMSPSPPATTVFSNKSAWRNMDFGTASTFVAQPEIDPRGWKRPPQGQRDQRLELVVTRQIDRLRRDDVLKWLRVAEPLTHVPGAAAGQKRFSEGSWASLKELTYLPVERDANFKEFVAQLDKVDAQVSQLTYLVHGCRRSGEFIKIHANNYELCERVGSYGYVLRHAGLGTAVWDVTLEGTQVKKVGQMERYQVQVPVDNTVPLRNRFVAKDKPTGIGGKVCGAVKAGSLGAATAALGLIGVAVYWPYRRRRNGQRKADEQR